jgi:hypothetical protein
MSLLIFQLDFDYFLVLSYFNFLAFILINFVELKLIYNSKYYNSDKAQLAHLYEEGFFDAKSLPPSEKLFFLHCTAIYSFFGINWITSVKHLGLILKLNKLIIINLCFNIIFHFIQDFILLGLIHFYIRPIGFLVKLHCCFIGFYFLTQLINYSFVKMRLRKFKQNANQNRRLECDDSMPHSYVSVSIDRSQIHSVNKSEFQSIKFDVMDNPNETFISYIDESEPLFDQVDAEKVGKKRFQFHHFAYDDEMKLLYVYDSLFNCIIVYNSTLDLNCHHNLNDELRFQSQNVDKLTYNKKRKSLLLIDFASKKMFALKYNDTSKSFDFVSELNLTFVAQNNFVEIDENFSLFALNTKSKNLSIFDFTSKKKMIMKSRLFVDWDSVNVSGTKQFLIANENAYLLCESAKSETGESLSNDTIAIANKFSMQLKNVISMQDFSRLNGIHVDRSLNVYTCSSNYICVINGDGLLLKTVHIELPVVYNVFSLDLNKLVFSSQPVPLLIRS